MIEFENLGFVYDGKVLFEHFSDTIQNGEKVVISGASGTGKSTLLSSIAGFVLPEEGVIRVDGLSVEGKNLSAIRSKLAWVPQEFALPYQDAGELIDTLFHLKINREQVPDRDQVLSVFAELGLPEEIYRKKMIEISGGQRQRVMIAVAALLNKGIILLDEPTSALDAGSVDGVIRYLKGMKDKTLVAVSHDRAFTEAFDRVIKL